MISVISNHVFGLKGGFIGVDIFFVISGYVISMLLFKKLSTDSFSLIEFYHHRVVRIIPPLFFVSIFIYVSMKTLLWDIDDYDFLKESFYYQAFFMQNFFFSESSANYFQGLISAKFNLHLWSLAVEEQFYILYPLVFVISYKYWGTIFVKILLLMFLVSSLIFMISSNLDAVIYEKILYNTQRLEVMNFDAIRYYMLPSRIFELLLGGGAFLITLRINQLIDNKVLYIKYNIIPLLSSLCLIAIMASVFSIDETMKWPSVVTLIPILATSVLLILIHLFGGDALPITSKNLVLSLIGKASYSLYLWHWPILSVLIYINSDFGESKEDYLIYFAIVAVFTSLTYLVVEKNRNFINKKYSFIILMVFMVFMIFISNENRKEEDFPHQIKTILETGKYASPCDVCARDDNRSKKFFVLWGDSHSQSLIKTLEQVSKNQNVNIIQIRGSLNDNHEKLFEMSHDKNYIGVILASRWSMYAVGFPNDEPEETGERFLTLNGSKAKDTVEALYYYKKHMNRLVMGLSHAPILIFKQVPRYSFMPVKETIIDFLGYRLRDLPVKNISDYRKDNEVVNSIFSNIKNKNVEFIDPAETLCNATECFWKEEFDLLYKDDDHLSVLGAEKFMYQLEESILKFKNRN
ncbi:acyltransferase family protein [Marinomonas sp. PE14-40]|uniref:acyltransferase family protein n=1 Tax=Marinomonas sp. PE14-40 TaxID=3060621 RepID=UPI003F66B130